MNFIKDETGLELIEYAITAGIISLGVIIFFSGVTLSLQGIFGELNTQMADANTAGQ